MASYSVLGRADSTEFAKAEYLTDLLKARLPAVTCHVHRVSPEEWEEACTAVCQKLGVARSHPLIWSGSGTLVGALGDCELMCERKYGVHIPATDAAGRPFDWDQRAAENQEHLSTSKQPPPAIEMPATAAAVSDSLLR